MNDFTKEELHFMCLAVTDLLKREIIIDEEIIILLVSLCIKLNNMLANYCEHD